MKERSIEVFQNGAKVRMHNRRITLLEDEGDFFLNFRIATKDAKEPACRHIEYKGKLRDTQIKISQEGIELLVIAYQKYMKQKEIKK